ncbi:metallophosphoesterase family protein [Brenneria corticis]|uniref:Calcineurin-like phosphoesterase domain-containing protein n=1 Tax=Brenneria corticis TaxID=2173106 RepID=A0A2U1TVI2_9GAMM|nr:metallophosphoesterase [Brenneria sp. CFCC 11842]PWC13389.1 hypothetical protein DDT56_15945 [Brenneria sp. CFCC 11842]
MSIWLRPPTRQAQKIAPHADFILHTGDFVEIAEAEDEWLDLMARSQKGFLQMSLAVVPGNHDEYGLDKKDLFPKKFNEHIHKVRPKLNWLTQQQVEHYNNLFEIGYQPQRSARFKNKHENYRDSSEQNFATYTIEGNKLTGAVYQVSGDLSKGEARRVFLVDKFSIVKE